GADQFPSDCAVLPPKLVPLVDPRVAHAGRSPLLVLPVLVHQLAKERRVALFERAAAPLAELLDVVKVLEHRGVRLLGPPLLVVEKRTGVPRKAGEEQEQIVLEIEQGVHADAEGAGFNGIVGVKTKAGDAAVRRRVLILLADRLAKRVDLDVTREAREL